jgi:hypothetical protein
VSEGSYHRGGTKYQIMAVGLTYVSITASFAPFVVQGMTEHATGGTGSLLGAFMGSLVLVGVCLAGPFLGGDVIQMFIIAFGLYQAWKLNLETTVVGPLHAVDFGRRRGSQLSLPYAQNCFENVGW